MRAAFQFPGGQGGEFPVEREEKPPLFTVRAVGVGAKAFKVGDAAVIESDGQRSAAVLGEVGGGVVVAEAVRRGGVVVATVVVRSSWGEGVDVRGVGGEFGEGDDAVETLECEDVVWADADGRGGGLVGGISEGGRGEGEVLFAEILGERRGVGRRLVIEGSLNVIAG